MTYEHRTPVEERYLAEVLARLRRLDNTDHGMFAEVLVAEALPGAVLAQAWGSWDVTWNEVRIQVKCSGERQSWHQPDKPPTLATWTAPKRRHWDAATDTFSDAQGRFADVYVMARHTGYDHLTGWTFYVLATNTLAEIATSGGNVSLAGLEKAGIQPVDADGLPDAVAHAHEEERARQP